MLFLNLCVWKDALGACSRNCFTEFYFEWHARIHLLWLSCMIAYWDNPKFILNFCSYYLFFGLNFVSLLKNLLYRSENISCHSHSIPANNWGKIRWVLNWAKLFGGYKQPWYKILKMSCIMESFSKFMTNGSIYER